MNGVGRIYPLATVGRAAARENVTMATAHEHGSMSSPLRTAGNTAVAIAAVIASLAGLASTAGVDTLGLVFVAASGLLLAGAALRLIGDRWFTLRPTESRRSRKLRMLVAGLGALALVPIIYSAGTAYGASWLEWDALHATNVYAERPGGFAVLLVSLAICAALTFFAIATAVVTAGLAFRTS
jgi:hypothetical protein